MKHAGQISTHAPAGMHSPARWLAGLLVPALLLSASCSLTRPVRDTATRHLLDATVPGRPGSASQPSLALAKPVLPAYLDRQQRVARAPGGTLTELDDELWAEPLDAGIARVLAANLSRLTGSGAIRPSGGFVSLDYDALLELRVDRFDPDPTGTVILEASWRIQPVTGDDTAFHPFRAEVPVAATTPTAADQLAAMNEALALLARAIARGL